MKTVMALLMMALAAGLLIVKQPSIGKRVELTSPALEKKLSAGDVLIDPGELLELMNNNQISLRILDVRSEADYNLFHLADATLVEDWQIMDPLWERSLPVEPVKVVVSNDGQRAREVWKILTAQGALNVYVLDGGINRWLNLYGEAAAGAPLERKSAPLGKDRLQYVFSAALGGMHPASDPDAAAMPERKFKKKVKLVGASGKKGGCG